MPGPVGPGGLGAYSVASKGRLKNCQGDQVDQVDPVGAGPASGWATCARCGGAVNGRDMVINGHRGVIDGRCRFKCALRGYKWMLRVVNGRGGL